MIGQHNDTFGPGAVEIARLEAEVKAWKEVALRLGKRVDPQAEDVMSPGRLFVEMGAIITVKEELRERNKRSKRAWVALVQGCPNGYKLQAPYQATADGVYGCAIRDEFLEITLGQGFGLTPEDAVLDALDKAQKMQAPATENEGNAEG